MGCSVSIMLTYMAKQWAMVLASGVVLAMVACKAGEPGKLETSVVQGVKKQITIGGKNDKNPIAYSDAAVKAGQEHFMHHCQTCHGFDGQNTGVPYAAKMDPPVPELTSKDVQEYTDGQLKWIIENGIAPSGMPAWKGILDDDEMWAMVHYIRHLPAKGSLGVPDVFKEEAEQHEHGKAEESKSKTHVHKDGTEHVHKQ
jgi:S-disulfanyl-L-cysteine oxidoreductase SoxD